MQLKKHGMILFILIGLLLGLSIDLMLRNEIKPLVCYIFPILFSLLFSIAYNEKQIPRLVISSLIVSLFLSIPLIGISIGTNPTNTEHLLTFLIMFPLFTFVGHAFHYGFHQDNGWRINYSSLFAAVWNTIPLLIVAIIFSSLANLLIILAAFIFKTVGNDFLYRLYYDDYHFRLISHVTLFFIGLGIGQQNIKIIYNIRILLLKMMYFLFPFLAIISIVYFLLYITQSATASDAISPLAVLIPLNYLGILFFNAYFQDGEIQTEIPKWIDISLRIYRVVLCLLILLMTYKILKTFTIGSNLFIYMLVTVFYGLTYAGTAFLPEPMEKIWVQRGNIAIALFFIISLFLFNLPYAPIDFTIGSRSLPAFHI